jgi:hypothetical protein
MLFRPMVAALLVLGSVPSSSDAASLRHFWRHSSQTEAHNYGVGHWRLNIARDTFSGAISCHLANDTNTIVYAAGALGFEIGHHTNALTSWVKTDDQPAVRWTDYLPELTRLGVPFDGARLDNPTDSIIWVPALALNDQSRIAIQPRTGKRPRVYFLQGFSVLRDSARALGCAPEGRFVR